MRHRRARRCDARGGRARGGPTRRCRRARRTPRARRSASSELLAGDVEAMKRRTRNYAKRQLTWMRKLAGRQRDRRHRARPGRRRARDPRLTPPDEIREVAGARQRLPDRRARRAAVRAHRRARAHALCEPHFGVVADGVLLLSPAGRPGARGGPADLQPRRLGGRAVGQRRARGDPVPAPPRLDRRATVLDRDRRRQDPPDDHRPGHVPRRHGAREPHLGGLPRRRRGRARRARTAERGATVALSARLDRQPAVRDPRRQRGASCRRSTCRRSGRRSKATPLFPNRTNVSWYCRARPAGPPSARIRARIFERGVGETLSSGTGASGAAVAYVLDRAGRPGRRERAGDRRARRRRAAWSRSARTCA